MPTGVYERTLEHRKAIGIRSTKQLFCNIEDCNGKYYAKGLCRKDYDKQHYLDNKTYIVKRKQKYYQANKEHIAIKSKQYQEDHKEHYAEWWKKYRNTIAGKAVIKASCHNRRTLKKGLTLAIVQRVYEANIVKYGQLTCVLCFKTIEFGDDSLEHLTPVSRGGSNDFNNLGISHLNCNIRKRAMTMDEWFAK